MTPPIFCNAFLLVTTIRCRSILMAPSSSRTLSERPTTSLAVPTIAAISSGLVLLAILILVVGDRLVGLRKLADF